MSVATLTFYAEDDPLGTPIGTLTDADVEIFEVREALWEMPAAHFQLPRNHSAITSGLIADNNYVTVTYPFISANPVFGFWLKDVQAAILSHNEQGGEYVQFGGPGVLGVLEHMRLWHSSAVDDQPTRGSAEVPGKWWWIDEPYGAILTRVIEEGQEADYGGPLADVTIDFDRVDDSDSNAWPNIDAEFEVEIGTDGLSVMEQLRDAGDLYVIGHPDLLIQAFNAYGTDRSGAFGSGNVRFEKGVNILTELTREGHMRGQGTHLLLRDKDGNYSTEVSPAYSAGDRAHHLYFEADQTNDVALLNKIGQEVLAASRTEPEQIELEYTVGNDEANGRYLPWLHFNVGDQVTVHTGSGILDYNEVTHTIVAFRVELDEAADDTSTTTQYRSIRVVVELNHRSRSDARTQPSLPSTPIPDPPTPGTPGTPATPTVIRSWSFTSGRQDDQESTHLWEGATTYLDPGVRWTWTGTASVNVLYATSPTGNRAQPNTDYQIVVNVDSRSGSGTRPFEVVWLADDGTGLRTDVLHADLPAGNHVFSPPTTPALTAGFRLRCTSSGMANLYVSYVAVQTVGSSTPGVPADGHPDLVGTTPQKYAQVDHSHAIHSAEAPDSNDDETEGYPVKTTWVQFDDADDPTQILGVWVLADNTEGAALWLPWPGGLDQEGFLTTTDATDDVTYTADAGSAHTIEDPTANVQDITLTEACTFTMPDPVDGKTFVVRLRQDGSGGHTATFTDVLWPDDTAPTLSTDPDAVDFLTFHSDGTEWYGLYAGAGGISNPDDVRDAGRWEVIVSGSAPPVATTNEAEDDWVYGWIPG